MAFNRSSIVPGVIALVIVTIIVVLYVKGRPKGWVQVIRNAGTNSSPRAIDLNGDDVLDIVMGAGGEEYDSTDYAVIALDGSTGELLWSVPGPNQIVGSALFMDITNDHIPDVFIGGRSAQFYAIDGSNGRVLWEYLKGYKSPDVTTDTLLLNFFNPQFIPDQDGDGVADLLAAFGGYVKAKPDEHERPAGQLMILSCKTGNVIHRAFMPDGMETYMSPLVYDFHHDGNEEIIFGTGGETMPGKLYVIGFNDFIQSGLTKAVAIDSSATKGFIAPPVIVDVTQDGTQGLVTISMDGIMRAYDGKNFSRLWMTSIHPRAEAQGMPVPVLFDDDDIPDFFGAFNVGVWPNNDTTIHAIISGATGKELFRDTLGMLQFSSPVLFNFNDDSHPDILYHINKKVKTPFFPIYRNQLMVYDGKSGVVTPLDTLTDGKNLGTTPLITDLDNDDHTDIIVCYMSQNDEYLTYKHLVIRRIELATPLRVNYWGGYMGTDYRSVVNFLDRE